MLDPVVRVVEVTVASSKELQLLVEVSKLTVWVQGVALAIVVFFVFIADIGFN